MTATEFVSFFCRTHRGCDPNLDVSGGLPIRERPKIGKLLSLEFLDEWDVLIIYKLDRGFRNHLDFVTFYHE